MMSGEGFIKINLLQRQLFVRKVMNYYFETDEGGRGEERNGPNDDCCCYPLVSAVLLTG